MTIYIRCVQMLAFIGWIAASSAAALAIDWKASVDGNFNDGTKWNGGIEPGSGDTAKFNRGSAANYTVTFPGDLLFNPTRTYTNGQLVVDNNIVTFARSAVRQLGPAKYELTDDSLGATHARGIIVGDGPADTVAILQTNLVSLSAQDATIGNQSGSVGTLVVDGGGVNITGPIFGSNEQTVLSVGYQGTGYLYVLNAGQMNVTGAGGDVGIGELSGAGNVYVSGAGSLMSVQGMGGRLIGSHGSLNVNLGGQLSTSSTAILLGGFIATVDGAGSVWTGPNGSSHRNRFGHAERDQRGNGERGKCIEQWAHSGRRLRIDLKHFGLANRLLAKLSPQ